MGMLKPKAMACKYGVPHLDGICDCYEKLDIKSYKNLKKEKIEPWMCGKCNKINFIEDNCKKCGNKKVINQ